MFRGEKSGKNSAWVNTKNKIKNCWKLFNGHHSPTHWAPFLFLSWGETKARVNFQWWSKKTYLNTKRVYLMKCSLINKRHKTFVSFTSGLCDEHFFMFVRRRLSLVCRLKLQLEGELMFNFSFNSIWLNVKIINSLIVDYQTFSLFFHRIIIRKVSA